MSFDSRSLERLRALGRQLPKALPQPETRMDTEPADGTRSSGSRRARHAVETEQDPEVLFRELMKASPDGRVPPHLLSRLREAEMRRLTPPPGSQPAEPALDRSSRSSRSKRSTTEAAEADEQARLYTAFQQLLLENDED
ncbi:hypothetical protein EVJ50_04215 [Synechococcus sp. RSCCF101]|uniref:hypothetical protein n=1 Tax=Synechococcus sp. RSCCF101 TaxID=2511069 RepID=UPI0012484722|nr:hypothetical protein [Synechococcus sp. RSCCF101]QEY31577.1 hypothetical protein EVJ50_04215 [Synechococcus sp. RSCCF101]